jgi:hypothetical protein
MAEKYIDWTGLKKKVDNDLQEDIDDEIQTVNDIIERENLDIKNMFNKNKGIIYLNDTDKDDSEEDSEWDNESDDDDQELDDNDFGLLPDNFSKKDISGIAWNNKQEDSKVDANERCSCNLKNIECIHLAEDDFDEDDDDDMYIYPINEDQDLCLCNECNKSLSAKIIEQMAKEMFL